jgi:hypothetical protein
MTPRFVRRLTLALAVVYAALGTLEVVLKVAGGSAVATIAFFGGTLLGGAGLIFCGLFAPVSSTPRRVLIILGAAAGLLASAWTLLVPVIAVTVIVANAHRPVVSRARTPQP